MKSYNVRIVDNEDGTFSIPWVHYCKPVKKTSYGVPISHEWKEVSPKRIKRLLAKVFSEAHE